MSLCERVPGILGILLGKSTEEKGMAPDLGVKQARKIGEKLKMELDGRKFVMYSSDLLRAKQTAENVGDFLGVTPILRKELRERNLGRCCGKSVQWLRNNIEQQEKTIDDRLFSDAESRRACRFGNVHRDENLRIKSGK